VSEYDDWLADFHAAFHILEPPDAYVECLLPEPVPQCYAGSQHLATMLLQGRSNGILYPSVRRTGGLCLTCFRPALVYRPRPGGRYKLQLTLEGTAYKTTVRPIRPRD
jgi:hypothetical protein